MVCFVFCFYRQVHLGSWEVSCLPKDRVFGVYLVQPYQERALVNIQHYGAYLSFFFFKLSFNLNSFEFLSICSFQRVWKRNKCNILCYTFKLVVYGGGWVYMWVWVYLHICGRHTRVYGYRCTWNQKTTAAVSPLVPSTILLFLFLRQSLTGTWDSLAGPQADWILNPRNLSTWLYFPHTEKTNHA